MEKALNPAATATHIPIITPCRFPAITEDELNLEDEYWILTSKTKNGGNGKDRRQGYRSSPST